ncbi:hypothetical protein NKI41_32575 [Mesorhizobium sp. M0601]|uniref:hypothetical protein n=1 Tax=Mesorhizobium sp. M0601 TaxID=2956969 RepID=UPI00333D5FE9
MRTHETGFAEVVVVPDKPVAASVPAAPPAVIELEIAGKVPLRIPLTTPPTLTAAMVKALAFHDPGPELGADLVGGRPDRYASRECRVSLCRFRRRWAGIPIYVSVVDMWRRGPEAANSAVIASFAAT